VDNVTNRRYAGSVVVNDANLRFYEPAPGANCCHRHAGEARLLTYYHRPSFAGWRWTRS
jgi:hypothetical protein